MLLYLNISLDKIPAKYVVDHPSGQYLNFMAYPRPKPTPKGYTHNIALLRTEQEILDDVPIILIGMGRKFKQPYGNDDFKHVYCNVNLKLIPEECVIFGKSGERFLPAIVSHYYNVDKDKHGYSHYIYIPQAKEESEETKPKIKIGRAKVFRRPGNIRKAYPKKDK